MQIKVSYMIVTQVLKIIFLSKYVQHFVKATAEAAATIHNWGSKILDDTYFINITISIIVIMMCTCNFINPRRMRREGYCSCRVCLSVCLLFDNSLHEWLFASKTNTHIQRRMEVKKYVGFSLKLLRSRVMASFTHLE